MVAETWGLIRLRKLETALVLSGNVGFVPIPVHVEVTPSIVTFEFSIVGDNAPPTVMPSPVTEN